MSGNPRMKIIIYFGHHKVGSTALQTYLARNTLPLLREGILYPAVESQGMSHLLAQAAGVQTKPDLSCMNLREPHNALAFRMLATKNNGKTPAWHGALPGLPAMLTTLRHQVEVLQPHTVILCSEVFSNFGHGHEDLIQKLHHLFPDAEQELYCALRRPDEYVVSWYGQRLRFGQKPRALSDGAALASTKGIHFDYQKVVEPWARIFCGAHMHLRNYNDILSAGGSVQDFIDQVSCKFPANLPQHGPSNSGIPRAAYEIVRRANHELSSENAGQMRRFFLDMPTSQLPVQNRDVELLGEGTRHDLAERFKPIHDYLNKVTGEVAFFPDIDEMRIARPISEQEATARMLDSLVPDTLQSDDLRTFVSQLKQILC
ncbi:hypothetical protein MACH18_36320 [Phaeobacter italicus]|jgi:hypothetical protein|nr:hypothetical protein MACH18_36320 [Phaeobacter italicus]